MKPDRGIRAGSCYNEHCQRPGALYVDLSTRKYYCGDCAKKLNERHEAGATEVPEGTGFAKWLRRCADTYRDNRDAMDPKLADIFEIILERYDTSQEPTPHPSGDAVREALEQLVEAYGNPEAGEVDRRLAMKDARAALNHRGEQ